MAAPSSSLQYLLPVLIIRIIKPQGGKQVTLLLPSGIGEEEEEEEEE